MMGNIHRKADPFGRTNCRAVIILPLFKNSCPAVFGKEGVVKSFAKFTGKDLCWRLFFNKVAGLQPRTLLTRSLQHRSFPVNFAKVFRTSIL